MENKLEHNSFAYNIKEDILTLEKVKKDKNLFNQIDKSFELIRKVFKNGNKILLAGNGGSVVESPHMAAEYVGRFLLNRQALAAISLKTDTYTITE